MSDAGGTLNLDEVRTMLVVVQVALEQWQRQELDEPTVDRRPCDVAWGSFVRVWQRDFGEHSGRPLGIALVELFEALEAWSCLEDVDEHSSAWSDAMAAVRAAWVAIGDDPIAFRERSRVALREYLEPPLVLH